MNDYYEYRSYTKGLWSRFLLRLISGLIIALLLLLFYGGPAGIFAHPLGWLLPLLVGIVILGYQLRNHPLKWKKIVLFDFKASAIFLYDGKAPPGAKDFGGIRLPFEEIEHYSIIHYDNILQSSYYLIKLKVKDNEVSLLSIKEPMELQEVVGLLKDRMQLPHIAYEDIPKQLR